MNNIKTGKELIKKYKPSKVTKEDTKLFVDIIKDKSIPLKDRWNLFKNGGGEIFGEKGGWIVHSPEELNKIFDTESEIFSFEGPVYCERYETVSSLDGAKILEESYNEEQVNAYKEWILSINLYDFKYDW